MTHIYVSDLTKIVSKFKYFHLSNAFESIVCDMVADLSRPQFVLKSIHLQSEAPTPRRYIHKSPCRHLYCLLNSLFGPKNIYGPICEENTCIRWICISSSWQDYYSIVLLLVSICFEINHYKRISPVCQRFHPVWFSTYFTGDFKGFLITIERLRCDMHSG